MILWEYLHPSSEPTSTWSRELYGLLEFTKGFWQNPLAKALRKLSSRHRIWEKGLFMDQQLLKRYGNKKRGINAQFSQLREENSRAPQGAALDLVCSFRDSLMIWKKGWTLKWQNWQKDNIFQAQNSLLNVMERYSQTRLLDSKYKKSNSLYEKKKSFANQGISFHSKRRSQSSFSLPISSSVSFQCPKNNAAGLVVVKSNQAS